MQDLSRTALQLRPLGLTSTPEEAPTVSDKELLQNAIDLLTSWEKDPFRWEVERFYYAIAPTKKILEHAHIGLSLEHPVKEYLYEIALARGILSGSNRR